MIPDTLTRRTRHGEQTYYRVAVETYIAANGRPKNYVVWRSTCRCCGAALYVTTSSSKRTLALKRGGLQTIHCPNHRQRTTHAARARDAALAERFGGPK